MDSTSSSYRLSRGFVAVGILFCLAFALFGTVPAMAQQRGHHRSFLERLLGIQPRRYPPAPPAPRRRAHPRQTKPAPRHIAPKPAAQTPPAVEKVDNARTILVVGDFIAGGLADGLKEAFAEVSDVTIVDRTNGSSGLVREDYYDWPGKIGAILDEVKPAITVVLVGSNDRQQIVVDGSSQPVLSNKWTQAYTSRARALAEAVVSRHIPLLWAGAPSFRSPSMSDDILAFDGIFRSVAAKVGGEFVDTWDGFVDDKGNFVFTGSDVNGQQVRLRGSDGINLTEAGKRKLAFYVEKPARRILGDATAGSGTRTNPATGPAAGRTVGAGMADRTAPIDLDDPAFDGDTALLGSAPLPSEPDTPRTLLVRDGKAEAPPPGRADDFAWPPGTKPEVIEKNKSKAPNDENPSGDQKIHPAGQKPSATPDPVADEKASLR